MFSIRWSLNIFLKLNDLCRYSQTFIIILRKLRFSFGNLKNPYLFLKKIYFWKILKKILFQTLSFFSWVFECADIVHFYTCPVSKSNRYQYKYDDVRRSNQNYFDLSPAPCWIWERTFRNTVQRNLETKQNRQTLETPEQTINNNNYVDDENPALTHTKQKQQQQQQRYKNFQKKFLNRK